MINKARRVGKGFLPFYLFTLLPFFASCADQFDQSYEVGRPDNVADYGYLSDYQPLKQYVDRTQYPSFRLGVGTTVSDYLKQELVYSLTNSNFDETVAGNAMKMASCVNDNGDMDFSTVSQYVSMATEAGLSVYGHTLAWHSQQPVKWLSSLIKDRELNIDPDATEEKLDYTIDYTKYDKFPFYVMGYEPQFSPDEGLISESPGEWYQYFAADGIPMVEGTAYKMTCEIKSDIDGTVPVNLQWGWGGGESTSSTLILAAGDWQEVSCQFTEVGGTNGFIVFQPGSLEGRFCMRNLRLTHSEALAVEMEQEVNKETYTDGPFPFYPMGCEPPVVDGCLHFVPTGDWSQFFVMPGSDNPLTEGDYVVYLDLTADKDASGVQLTMQNGWGSDAQNLTQAVVVEAGQHNYRLSFPAIVGGNYDIILKPQTADAVLDLRSVTVCKVVKLNSLPLSDEEKRDTLTWAMERWVSGMMEACEGNVKAWDVVNEAVSGGSPDSEGVYALQHGTEGNTTDFFWQDYLGDIDYVRTAVRLARQYGPEDVKLFVNDYNLESDWDQNQKLRSLIAWIKRWEADGVTKIDGIGSQMHISCYMDPATQESKKKAITSMLRLMAETGKFVRISELDMGLVDANGNDVQTADVTEEQHKAMADLYRFVVEQYLAIVPPAQQWGICQWAATDSPAGSGWRANSPIGLWDLNYYRKHTYAGFADGLSGK